MLASVNSDIGDAALVLGLSAAVFGATMACARSVVASMSGSAAENSASVTSTWRESTHAASTPCWRKAAATIRLLASSPIACS